MTTVQHNFTTLEMYDSIEEAPITRFHLFNKYLVIDSGIGSNASDVDAHIGRITSLIDRDSAKAKVELENMRQNIIMMLSNISPETNAFVCMIKSINGKEVKDEDLTELGIQKIIAELGRRKVPTGIIQKTLAAIKKKLTLNLSSFFSSWWMTRISKSYTTE